MSLSLQEQAGQRAEARVCASLATLPPPWQFFHTVEWRTLRSGGEAIGEADAVVFHAQLGLIVLEIKAGAVEVRDGRWFYGSGQPMKQSPFSQARRNRYALLEKLQQRLGAEGASVLPITHAVWFPDVVWRGPVPSTDAPSPAFVLDRGALADPEAALRRLLREALPESQSWTRAQQHVLKELLAPDCRQLVPLASRVDDAVMSLHQATEQQIAALRLLRSQPRLLVEGGAGSGKTLLAVALAREHAAQGRSVLLTCYNRHLAQHLEQALSGVSGITVRHFHELVRSVAVAAGWDYAVPQDEAARARFFQEECAELLLNAAEAGGARFDTLIVDEAADFRSTWWVALEALGAPGFSWYCFYDRHQAIYQSTAEWTAPYPGVPFVLEANLRNTRPIGEMAARLGDCPVPPEFRVAAGEAPVLQISRGFAEMALQLRQLLRTLLRKEDLRPEQIVVLAPYRHSNARSGWAAGLDEVSVSTDMAQPRTGQLRVGTIQGFKGLEADVVILAGLDAPASRQPQWLYVGASRARAALFVLALESTGLA